MRYIIAGLAAAGTLTACGAAVPSSFVTTETATETSTVQVTTTKTVQPSSTVHTWPYTVGSLEFRVFDFNRDAEMSNGEFICSFAMHENPLNGDNADALVEEMYRDISAKDPDFTRTRAEGLIRYTTSNGCALAMRPSL